MFPAGFLVLNGFLVVAKHLADIASHEVKVAKIHDQIPVMIIYTTSQDATESSGRLIFPGSSGVG
jgi:hypothetical protein